MRRYYVLLGSVLVVGVAPAAPPGPIPPTGGTDANGQRLPAFPARPHVIPTDAPARPAFVPVSKTKRPTSLLAALAAGPAALTDWTIANVPAAPLGRGRTTTTTLRTPRR